MKRSVLTIFLVIFFASAYILTGQMIGDDNWGFNFKAPSGWVHQQGPDGAVPGHNTIAGMIIVMPHLAASLQKVIGELQAGPTEEGTQLAGAADNIAKSMQYVKVDTSALTAHFSGAWVSYTSNTESYMTLMPNGEYSDSYVSSYSGELSDGWSGEQTGSWG
ncbi:MAG TPA: hypothetical protein ENI15_04825 [Spirochaetes bacterium]|nr:hypothetical protein [Spirochaetota bacterium]